MKTLTLPKKKLLHASIKKISEGENQQVSDRPQFTPEQEQEILQEMKELHDFIGLFWRQVDFMCTSATRAMNNLSTKTASTDPQITKEEVINEFGLGTFFQKISEAYSGLEEEIQRAEELVAQSSKQ